MNILDRSALFNQESGRIRRENNKTTFVKDCHPALRELYRIFRELQKIVGLSDDFLGVMPEPPYALGYPKIKPQRSSGRARLKKLEVTAKGMLKCRGGSVRFVTFNIVRFALTIILIVILRM